MAKDNPAVYELMKKVDLLESKELAKNQLKEAYYGEVKSSNWVNYGGPSAK